MYGFVTNDEVPPLDKLCYNINMEKLICKSHKLKISPGQEQVFAAIRKEMGENIGLFENLGLPIAYVGKDKTPLTPYEGLKDQMSPEEYFKYVCQLIDTPQDIHNIINKPFMKWQADTPADVIQDQLNEADVTLANGGADCDNISWVAKRLFEALSCKTGFDYKPRVIVIGTHAVCIYNDKDEKMYSIDQDAKVEPFMDIYQASQEFKGVKGKKNPKEIFLKADAQVQFTISQDPENLEKTYESLGVRFRFDYAKNADFLKFLPKDWKKFERCELYFRQKAVTVFYQFGVLAQENLADGTEVTYTGKNDYQISYPTGEVEREHFHNGKITQRDFKDGSAELYDKKTGEKYQVNKPDGSTLVFKNGKLRQKNFPDTDALEFEVYEETGEVFQRGFRSEKSPYKSEWYENGKLVQVKTWEGEIIKK